MKALATATIVAAICSAASYGQPASQPATAPATAPATGPAISVFLPDLCDSAVDPYRAGKEREKFFKAAGIDLEMDQTEFAADAAGKNGFVRPFDKWSSMLRYDKDGNRKLDWLEVDAYRQAFRGKVLAAFDVNKDGKLIRGERDQANRALAAGKISLEGLADARQAVSAPAQFISPEALARYDADADGVLSDQERRQAAAAFRQQWQDRMIQRFDTDGDGQLSAEERRAAFQAMSAASGRPAADLPARPGEQAGPGGPGRTALLGGGLAGRIGLKLFDRDGDGTLDDAEREASTEFGKQVTDLFQSLSQRAMDADGDGRVSDSERDDYRRQFREAAMQWMTAAQDKMDADGDGQVSPQERLRYFRQVQTGIEGWTDKFVDRFDQDHNGRYSDAEISQLTSGLKKELATRYNAYDVNKDGRLDPQEALAMMASLAENPDDSSRGSR